MVDLRKLRPSNITSAEYSHILLALFWPAFGFCFWLLEVLRPASACYPVWCPLDDRIPFCEPFMIPYLFWFVFLVGMNLYLGLFDPGAFRRFMRFIMITYGGSLLIYAICPTCQELRPETFPRDNLLTRWVADFYDFDTNTNVCPSLHAVGSFAVAFGAWDTRRFRKWGWRIAFGVTACVIAISTVFVKQHSILDVFWAVVLSAAAYVIVYRLPHRRKMPESN